MHDFDVRHIIKKYIKAGVPYTKFITSDGGKNCGD